MSLEFEDELIQVEKIVFYQCLYFLHVKLHLALVIPYQVRTQ